jgi:DinB superfamily
MHEDLRRLQNEVTKALSGLTVSQTQATPLDHPEKWSIQQIVEHLLQTYRGSIPAIQARIDRGSGTRAKPTPRQRLGQLYIITLGRFPGGRTAPAAVSPALPSTPHDGQDLIERVSAELIRMDEVTARGEQRFGDRRAVSHIILGPLSMRQWRRFHLVHGLHHVRQIHAIRRDHRI